MTSRLFYHKQTGAPVQIIARAQTKPTYQEVICYQELTKPYDHFVMEKRQFFAEYVKEFAELPLVGRKQIEKREDLPNKQPRISKGEIMDDEPAEAEKPEEAKEPEVPEAIQKMLAFLDAHLHPYVRLHQLSQEIPSALTALVQSVPESYFFLPAASAIHGNGFHHTVFLCGNYSQSVSPVTFIFFSHTKFRHNSLESVFVIL